MPPPESDLGSQCIGRELLLSVPHLLIRRFSVDGVDVLGGETRLDVRFVDSSYDWDVCIEGGGADDDRVGR